MSAIATIVTIPAIFFGHGSPMNAIEQNKYTKSWVEIAKKIPKPKAIIAISAHWETNGTKITSNKMPKTIHDFYGFPSSLYDISYNAKGSLELAEKVRQLAPEIKFDESWGLDHGTWSILRHIYPNADTAVLQISIDRNKTPKEHYKLAQKLKSLRNEGILIMASGNIVHNLRALRWHGNQDPYPFATKFNDAVKSAIINGDIPKILNYESMIGAPESAPTSEHFIPLIYILGVQNRGEKASFFAQGFEMGSLSMDGFVVG